MITAGEFEPIRNIEVFRMNNNVCYLYIFKKGFEKKLPIKVNAFVIIL